MEKFKINRENILDVVVKKFEPCNNISLNIVNDNDFLRRIFIFKYNDEFCFVDAYTGEEYPLLIMDEELIDCDIYANTFYVSGYYDIKPELTDEDIVFANAALQRFLNIKKLKEEGKLIDFPRKLIYEKKDIDY